MIQRIISLPQASQCAKYLSVLLHFGEWGKLFFDVGPVESIMVADDDSFRVADVEWAGGEQLEDNQVFG